MSGTERDPNKTLTQQTLIWDFQIDPVADAQTALSPQLEKDSPTFISEIDFSEENLYQKDESTWLEERYEVLDLLGKGGMGEVLRVRDHKFNRTLAMKIIHPSLLNSALILQLFLKEAKSTASLQHPGIVPVHDFGTLTDGRLYFTMQEVQGITLKEAIQNLHHPTTPSDWKEVRGNWSIQRLLNAFERICEALAYAHDQGIMHRDIKPSNFMLGKHGEVLVMDWGIAKILPHGEQNFSEVNVIRPNVGSVVGTPDYIAPEQAEGESEKVSAHSDVFSLGCVLYEILTGKSIRTKQTDFKSIIHQVCPSLPTSDSELQMIYTNCIQLDPACRYPNAGALHADLSRWLDGENKRQRALKWVEKANQTHQSVLERYALMEQYAQQIQYLKDNLPKWASLQEKEPLWLLEDAQQKLQYEINLLEMNRIEWLNSALNQAPNLDVAHQALTRIYHEQHQRALRQRNHNQATLTLEQMRIHDRGEFTEYLSGMGAVKIQIQEGEVAKLFQIQEHMRRLQPTYVSTISKNTEMELAVGSYILTTSTGLQIPITLSREKRTLEIQVPHNLHLGENEVLVTAGTAWIGAHNEPNNPYRQVHVDTFVMQKHPVTNHAYIQFLNSLMHTGQTDAAMRHVPQTNGLSDSERQQLYHWDEANATFTLEPDPQGDCWDPNWPVLMISAEDALSYAKWYSTQTGISWRLPTPVEWEKAARGTDGRILPWGNYFEPTWACVRGNHAGRALPATIDAYPMDESVYGIRGLAGNMQDMCIDPQDPTHMVSKGGAWSHHPEFIHLANETRFSKTIRLETVGFRLVRTVQTPD